MELSHLTANGLGEKILEMFSSDSIAQIHHLTACTTTIETTSRFSIRFHVLLLTNPTKRLQIVLSNRSRGIPVLIPIVLQNRSRVHLLLVVASQRKQERKIQLIMTPRQLKFLIWMNFRLHVMTSRRKLAVYLISILIFRIVLTIAFFFKETLRLLLLHRHNMMRCKDHQVWLGDVIGNRICVHHKNFMKSAKLAVQDSTFYVRRL